MCALEICGGHEEAACEAEVRLIADVCREGVV